MYNKNYLKMNNFFTWCCHYDHILYPYYLDFKSLFEKDQEPSYKDFLTYCYSNTTKIKKSGILTAYITPHA